MLERIKRKLGALRADATEDQNVPARLTGTTEPSGAAPTQLLSSRLFQCPSCETVYIAVTKDACGTCNADVSQVRSTFAGQMDCPTDATSPVERGD